MSTRSSRQKIEIRTAVNAPHDQVWLFYSAPEHITQWNSASEDWHTPHAENDFTPGGRYLCRMEARDKSFGFDFSGTYDEIKPQTHIAYTLDDGRKVWVDFRELGGKTEIIQVVEAEDSPSLDAQKSRWQAILDHFSHYTEENG